MNMYREELFPEKNFDGNLFSKKTIDLALLVTEKLGKLNVRMSQIFVDYQMPSRIFAFVESKYSSEIEGIYTTLFDVVNTGKMNEKQHLLKPIVDALFSGKQQLTLDKIREIAQTMNANINPANRWKSDFGVYHSKNGKKVKIYTPPMNPDDVENLLEKIVDKSLQDRNILQILHTHILFEKIHPFVDANGRIGRLILQKSLSQIMNFTSVLPLSNAFLRMSTFYYEAFELNSHSVDESIQMLLEILLFMYETTKKFLIDLNKWFSKTIAIVQQTSTKITPAIATDILMCLQTKSHYLNKRYGFNVKTIDSIFNKLNSANERGEILPFNRKIIKGYVCYWNIELEEIIDKHFVSF